MFLGYPQHQKGYKLLNLLTHRRFVSRDVVFYEHIFPYSKASMHQVLQPIPAPLSSPGWYDDFVSTNTDSTQASVPESVVNDASHTENVNEQIPEVVNESVHVPSPPEPPEVVRRSSRVSVKPTWLKDFVTPHQPRANQVSVTSLETEFHAFLCALLAQQTPTSFKKLLNNQIGAMQ